MCTNINLERFRRRDPLRASSTRNQQNTMRQQKIIPFGIKYLYLNFKGFLLSARTVDCEFLGRKSLGESFHLIRSCLVLGQLEELLRLDLLISNQRGTLLQFGVFVLDVSVGADATIISWIQGYQYTQRGSGRIHQISQEDHPLGPVQVDHRITDRWSSLGTGKRVSSLLRLRGSSCQFNVNESTRKGPRIKSKWEFESSDRPPCGVKVTKKPSDDGTLVRAETPNKEPKWRKWNSRKSYREHPYWTNNLKYVC